jgi:DNA-binding NtrC family response regulator
VKRDDSGFDQVETLVHSQDASRARPLRVVADDGAWSLAGASAERMLVGTSPVCAIRLSDPHVSRRHAAFELRRGRVHIVDLESTNGTFVDGVAVSDAPLAEGQTIRVGDTRLRLVSDEASDAIELSPATSFGRVAGGSVAMRRLYPLCERLAQTNVPVIIEGETGTGKEVLAEALHEMGPRAKGPFVVFDCTAVPPNLVESELFGHEKGAFTGAVATRKGVFEQADGGTLLIDELGDLELALQPKLLRAIERSEVRRVGGNQVIRFDVRIISATRRDLDREIEAGRFRDDLFHRLAVARVELPPLRKRIGDVPRLAEKFWTALGGDLAKAPSDLFQRWSGEPWVGNVRELRNAVARELALGGLGRVAHKSAKSEPPKGDDLVTRILERDEPLAVARRLMQDELDARYLERLLDKNDGDTARVAEIAGVSRRYVQALLARRAK